MRNVNLKKMLELDTAFEDAVKNKDAAKAIALCEEQENLNTQLTPLEQYKYLKIQIRKLTQRPLDEIENIIAKMSKSNSIARKTVTAVLVFDQAAKHLKLLKQNTGDLSDRPILLPSQAVANASQPKAQQS